MLAKYSQDEVVVQKVQQWSDKDKEDLVVNAAEYVKTFDLVPKIKDFYAKEDHTYEDLDRFATVLMIFDDIMVINDFLYSLQLQTEAAKKALGIFNVIKWKCSFALVVDPELLAKGTKHYKPMYNVLPWATTETQETVKPNE